MQIVWGMWKGCWHHARWRDAQRGNNRYRPALVLADSLPTSNAHAHTVHTHTLPFHTCPCHTDVPHILCHTWNSSDRCREPWSNCFVTR